MWAACAAAGDEIITSTPEFGPAPYMWLDPRTDKPLVNVRVVNHWIGCELASHFAKTYGADSAATMAPECEIAYDE
jgi:hypothetical protein